MNYLSRNHDRFVHHALLFGLATIAISLTMAGCSRGPARVEVPAYDPSGSAEQAMELYDKDGDGLLAGEELNAAPSLSASMTTLDADKDGKISEMEIASRINTWQSTGTGITSIRCRVTLDGKPLSQAEVIFEPEEFLNDTIQVAVGTTNRDGVVNPKIPKEKRPNADTPPGIQLGFYKIRITKQENGSERIPAKYNTETILGQQIAPDDPAILSQVVRFNLTTRD